MANCLDEGIGNVTAALKKKGMWENTVMFFSSDNGGPVHDPAGGCVGQSSSNNFPLRGGKVSDFEGGVRVVAFLSGGGIPDSIRGSKREGMMHITDMHGTICYLAGVEIADVRLML